MCLAKGGRGVRSPRVVGEQNWQQNYYCTCEERWLPSTNFKLFSQINGISTNDRNVFKVLFFVRGNHCYFSVRISKSLAVPQVLGILE